MPLHADPERRGRPSAAQFIVRLVVLVTLTATMVGLVPSGRRTERARGAFPAATSTPSVRPSPIVPPRSTAPARPGPYPRIFDRIDTSDPVVFVTIDDGWWHDWRVVRLVRRWRTPMTVFLTEEAARDRRARFFVALAAAGARIENHTMHHPILPRISRWAVRHEICSASTRFAARFGRRPSMFRPPYGLLDGRTVQAAWRCGIRWIVQWNAEVLDQRLVTSSGRRLRRGDIVLLHFRPELREDLAVLQREVRRRGFRIAALEDYLPGGSRVGTTRRPRRG